jgi:putative DNA primase/helicase
MSTYEVSSELYASIEASMVKDPLELVANTDTIIEEKRVSLVTNNAVSIDGNNGDSFFDGNKFIITRVVDWLRSDNHIINVNNELYVYKDGVYIEAESTIRRVITTKLGEGTTPRRVSDVVNTLKDLLVVSDIESMAFPDNTFNLKNGWFDLHTQQLSEHSPDRKTIYQIPVNYNPDADTQYFDKFIELVNPLHRETLEEVTGYCLISDMSLEKAVMLYAPQGENGKGSLLALITTMLGKNNVSGQSIQSLSNNRFATSVLFGKMANIYADLPGGVIEDTDKFKMLTSGDSLDAEKKGRDMFSFNNKAKMLFSSNHLPTAKKAGKDFTRRWVTIPFTGKFSDRALRARMLQPDAIEGALLRAIEGATRLMNNEKFTITNEMSALLKQYGNILDPCNEYFENYLALAEGICIEKQRVYDGYVRWCGEQGRQSISQISFNMKLQQEFKVEAKRQGTKKTHNWVGLRFTNWWE